MRKVVPLEVYFNDEVILHFFKDVMYMLWWSEVIQHHLLQIIFEAKVGGQLGDIALDDLSITNGMCALTPSGALPAGATTPAPQTTGSTNAVVVTSGKVHIKWQKKSPVRAIASCDCLVKMFWWVTLWHNGKWPNGTQWIWLLLPTTFLFFSLIYKCLLKYVWIFFSNFNNIWTLLVYLPAAGAFDCNFESNICGWTQATDDQFDWLRNQGRTGSTSTGPSFDHTTGRKYIVKF